MILYMENRKQFTKKLLTLTNDFRKVAEYKLNIDIKLNNAYMKVNQFGGYAILIAMSSDL